jgi:hypothetical protein
VTSTVSRDFLIALKLADEPMYRIAMRAGLHPSTLSKIITGAERLAPSDRRVLAVAKVIGLPADQCFAPRDVSAPEVAR